MAVIPVFVLAGQSNANKAGIDNRLVERLVAQGNAFEFVKVAESSTSIYPTANRDDWSPSTGELFAQLVTAIKTAVANISSQGDTAQLNILWVQGENDTGSSASSYATALTNFITQLRTQVGDASAKFYISTLPYASTVRTAEYSTAAELSNVYTIDTTGAGTWDGIHYDKPTAEHIADTFFDMTGVTVANIPNYHNMLDTTATVDNSNAHMTITGPRYLDYTYTGGDAGYGIRTFSGDDNITTGAGNDTIFTGGNSDTVHSGGGNDYVMLEEHDDIAWAGGGNDFVSGGAGKDTIYGEDGNDSLAGDSENDSISGGNGNDTITGDDGNDSLTGDAGDDSITGGNGNDTIDGGAGADYLNGLADADSLIGGDGNDTLYGDLGNDTLNGRTGDDYLSGGDGDDRLSAGGGQDTLYGNDGNDTLSGSGGASTAYLFGGAGNDTYYAYGSGDIVSETAVSGVNDGGTDTVIATVNFVLAAYIENLTIKGAATGTGNTLNNLMIAAVTGAGIYGMDGNDTLTAQIGGTLADGGSGNDSILYGGRNTTLRGGDGDDIFTASAGDLSGDNIDGGAGIDTLSYATTGHGVNVDLLNGVTSAGETVSNIEIVIGSALADTVQGGAGNDQVLGGSGKDILYGQDGNDLLSGDAQDDTLVGGNGDDRLYGQDDNDMLQGDGGTNILDGGAGNDSLVAGGGTDLLTGGTGADSFYFNSPVAPPDFVLDFNPAEGDRLVFTSAAFGVTTGYSLTEGVGLLQGPDIHVTTATATFYYNTITKALWFDADGSGPAEAHILAFLMNAPVLHAQDFVFM